MGLSPQAGNGVVLFAAGPGHSLRRIGQPAGALENLGARLEGTNKVYSTHIIISEFTYEHVKDRIVARELDLIRVKGKELPVKIYELIEVKE